MDYLPKAVEDGVVDNLSSCCAILIVVDSPSSLQSKTMAQSLKSKC